jgi:hypothetical protein
MILLAEDLQIGFRAEQRCKPIVPGASCTRWEAGEVSNRLDVIDLHFGSGKLLLTSSTHVGDCQLLGDRSVFVGFKSLTSSTKEDSFTLWAVY